MIRGGRRIRLAIALTAVAVTAVAADASAQAPPLTEATIADGPGRVFHGVGGLSAGASTRLLRDYPDPARSRVLDALFKPGAGAALHQLKVEIGGDTNSTDGAEHSHMRHPGRIHCGRGYEWWLMHEARRRNPRIRLGALAWGFPSWVEPWTPDMTAYYLAWLRCARSRGLEIDNIGGWNERGFQPQWLKDFRRALDANGFDDVKLVADDSFGWAIATATALDPTLAAAVDVIGQHYPCGIFESESISCSSPPDARALGKPLWASEQWWNNYATRGSAGFLARELNQVYIDGRMTATIVWPLVNSFYDSFPNPHDGLLRASEPWSGRFEVGRALWTIAHTTQFAHPGWRYVDSASKKLAGGGSIVTLRARRAWSAIVETDRAAGPQRLRLKLGDGVSAGRVRVWATDLRSATSRHWLQRQPAATVSGRHVELTLRPGRLYSLTTAAGAGRSRPGASPPAARWELPYRERFDGRRRGHSPPFFSDLDGAFEVQPCIGRRGGCLRQRVTAQPVPWSAAPPSPRTVVGEPLWWGDYQVDVDVLLEQRGHVEIGGRLGREHYNNLTLPGYYARLSSTGAWLLYRQEWQGGAVPLASGTVAAPGTRQWRHVRLRFAGDRIELAIGGTVVARVRDRSYRIGQVGLGASTWTNAEYDNLAVTSTARAPKLVPLRATRAVASGSLTGPYAPSNAVDDNRGTIWHSPYPAVPPAPHTLTIDLGCERQTNALLYEPRTDESPNGIITGYTVELRREGRRFEPVARGSWPADLAAKAATWPARRARFVRLVARESTAGVAAASEIHVGAVPGARGRVFR